MKKIKKQLICFGIFIIILNFTVYNLIIKENKSNIITGNYICNSEIGKVGQIAFNKINECEKINYAYYYVKLNWIVYILGIICIFKGFNDKNEAEAVRQPQYQ